jgi:hypothetical protein
MTSRAFGFGRVGEPGQTLMAEHSRALLGDRTPALQESDPFVHIGFIRPRVIATLFEGIQNLPVAKRED